ncbi:MarR family transcriptional regulator [Streptomyces sp. MS19]|uniref:MarR family transcriptional regulator n=1 Tax=Streptomyces sp. MS19 TaxID=3385972 RepID=UPI0039A1BF7C
MCAPAKGPTGGNRTRRCGGARCRLGRPQAAGQGRPPPARRGRGRHRRSARRSPRRPARTVSRSPRGGCAWRPRGRRTTRGARPGRGCTARPRRLWDGGHRRRSRRACARTCGPSRAARGRRGRSPPRPPPCGRRAPARPGRRRQDLRRRRAPAPATRALREPDGPLTRKRLAARMSCEPSHATFVVDRLEKRGLIERRPHPTDRRAGEPHLTGSGGALRLLERAVGQR